MRAMVLAAGLGTRLRPLTDDRPKALVEVAGHTLLEITLRRLASFGIREVIVNVHHFADRVVEYLQTHKHFGMHIEVSREPSLLDTGGGLKKAAGFFLPAGNQRPEPFLLHNVDVVSTIDLGQMVARHREQGSLATLAVQKRDTSRQLLFDENNHLCGRRTGRDQPEEIVRAAPATRARAFSGIHVISPELLGKITEDGVFSIITTYLRLAREAENITAFDADGFYWRDLGKLENIAQAEGDLERRLFRV
jgi:mannose-1-phosphate guanylyltransferase